MSPPEERLAVALGVNGINAWGRLYRTLSGKLEFDMAYPDGRRATLPMSQRRSLLANPDRATRRAAFEGGNAAWAQVEDVAAAAINAISGPVSRSTSAAVWITFSMSPSSRPQRRGARWMPCSKRSLIRWSCRGEFCDSRHGR